jgi:hypothetical protein
LLSSLLFLRALEQSSSRRLLLVSFSGPVISFRALLKSFKPCARVLISSRRTASLPDFGKSRFPWRRAKDAVAGCADPDLPGGSPRPTASARASISARHSRSDVARPSGRGGAACARGEPAVTGMARVVLPPAGGARSGGRVARVPGSPRWLGERQEGPARVACSAPASAGRTRGSARSPARRLEGPTPTHMPGTRPASRRTGLSEAAQSLHGPFLPSSPPHPPRSHSSWSPTARLVPLPSFETKFLAVRG